MGRILFCRFSCQAKRLSPASCLIVEAKRMRTLRNIAIGTVALIVVFLAFAVVVNAWDRAHTYYPALENESAFLRTYSLKAVVLPYVEPPGGTSDLHGSGGGAGTESVEHTANFGEYFTMRSERKGLLMEAVHYDLQQKLRTSGMQVLSQNGDVPSGYRFRYRSENSFGSVTIHPLEPGRVQRNLPLADGMEDVGVRVEIKEEWFPKGLQSN